MVKDHGKGDSVVRTEALHNCSPCCLGPLTFHQQVVGDKVRLSHSGLLAERTGDSLTNGLVFSSRKVEIQERICLRVEKELFQWQGALRLGFTNVPPSARSLPLPLMAIPNLTEQPGHWAAPVPESVCQDGSELEFWVSYGGNIYITSNSVKKHKLIIGVDLSKPLWAMIDIYGHTSSILLLGSEKRYSFNIRRSCPVPKHITSSCVGRCRSPDISSLFENSDESISCLDTEGLSGECNVLDCVVCMGKQATVTLPCGHRCMCNLCTTRVLKEFGSCPLCRHNIRAPTVEARL